MTLFKRLLFAVTLLMLVVPVLANAQQTTMLIGTVVQVIQLGEDHFVQLDINGDGVADALLKLSPTDVVFDGQGQQRSGAQVTVGMQITVTVARQDSQTGYYEVPDPTNPTQPQAQVPLAGTVVQTLQVGTDLFVLLDTNGDGIGDVEVKLDSTATVLGPDGQPIALADVQVGTQLTVPQYDYNNDSGLFEAQGAGNDNGTGNDGGDGSGDGGEDN